jgi:hypothetical protein
MASPLSFFTLVLVLFPLLAFAQADRPGVSRVVPPEADRVSPSRPGDLIDFRAPAGGYSISFHDGDRKVYGFSFENEGVNPVVPEKPECIGCGPYREYRFLFRDRARQNMHMAVTDSPTDRISQRMGSRIYFFPRKNLPAIRLDADRGMVVVTLPTGETVDFDAKTKYVTGGALEEVAPVDRNPDRFARKFAQIVYRGSGTVVRVNKRGGDPGLKTVATITRGDQTCSVDSKFLFNQDERSDVEFLFPTDEEFHEFLLKRCGFGL